MSSKTHLSEGICTQAAGNTQHLRSDVLLGQLSAGARKRAEDALTAALVRPAALELADALEAKLKEAREAAVGPEKAVADAQKALTAEQQSVVGRLAAFWQSKHRADANDREREPERETPEVAAAKAALATAEAEARPFLQELRYREEQVAGLRACSEPDPDVLTVLAETIRRMP